MSTADEYPWAVENRVVKGPPIALFRDEIEAEEYAEDFIDLRVRPLSELQATDTEQAVLEAAVAFAGSTGSHYDPEGGWSYRLGDPTAVLDAVEAYLKERGRA